MQAAAASETYGSTRAHTRHAREDTIANERKARMDGLGKEREFVSAGRMNGRSGAEACTWGRKR